MNHYSNTLFDLEGSTALITGGSRGIGLQIAEALGSAGARLMLTARKEAELEAAAAHLGKLGIEASWIAADSSDPSEVQRVCSKTFDTLGHLDILVNNAGTSWGASAETHTLQAWDRVMNLNIRSLFLFSQQAAVGSMIPRKRGRIINIASIAGLGGNPAPMECVAYNTSKGAVITFTRALAAEWGKHGINVNAISPGLFPSKMADGVIAAFGEERIISTTPLGRLGDPDDLKGAALLLASAAGKHMTGHAIVVDGGTSSVIGA
ncbi:SDR family oxidoreductase [Variovorax sp. V116]|jgi:gluconate 5-dehydrogenase|uniref:SDR family oxidoreductase n=1 Tax=Variovorax sp. V116 TaxID=3065953 RepID=UPI0034E85446